MTPTNGFNSDSQSLRDAQAHIEKSLKVDLLGATHVENNAAMRKQISRSFISDTVTTPSPEMLEYALKASLGDDVYSADTCVSALETHIASLTGKEAGLFMASGTMSNQIGIRTHLTQPPYNVLLDYRAHIYAHEAGGLAANSNAQAIPIRPSNNHHLTLEDVKENIVLSEDVHMCPTRIIALENTLAGTIFPQDEIIRISSWAKENGIIMHLDGARIWHAAYQTGLSLKELCDPFDSVSLCFSKGLGAPIGSLLVGKASFILKARHFRKMMGGGMRQVGFAAASAGFSLNENYPLLGQTHVLAKKLEDGLKAIGADILIPTETNMVFYGKQGVLFSEIKERLANLPEPIQQNGSRIVVHFQNTPQAIEDFLVTVRTLVEEKKKLGLVADDYSAPTKVSSMYGKT
ncbi:pyridoxal phosphate-dependent transferase [Flagelloscypha sp. PMI_526]|nr:pyridoxal phosphate-dependent transferase [Flagelloscypha sp. PMI_526]